MGSKAALREAFILFDTDADGMIGVRDIATVVRSFGVNLSDVETEKMMKGKENALLSYDDFAKLAESKCSGKIGRY